MLPFTVIVNNNNKKSFTYKEECLKNPDPYPKSEQICRSFRKIKQQKKRLVQLRCFNKYHGRPVYTLEKMCDNNNAMPYLC